MAELSEILMIEHLAIRHISTGMSVENGEQKFSGFHHYLLECHIPIEEKILFPMLEAQPWEDSKSFNANARRIMADHKLIDTLSGNIVKWYDEGNFETLGSRFPMYFRLLLEHNGKEEETVFPRWGNLPREELESARKEAENIVLSFGKKAYLGVTGMTEHSFNYFFRK